MKKLLFWMLLTTVAVAQVSPPSTQSRVAGRFVAYNYGTWQVQIYNAPAGTGSQTFSVASSQVRLTDGRTFMPFNVNAPIFVGKEQVTPSAVGAGCINAQTAPGSCVLTATFSQTHTTAEYVQPATYGLQEALNDAGATSGGAVTLDSAWASLGGTTAIKNAATIPSNTGIEDARVGPPALSPGGTAGGDLSGSYPNPTVSGAHITSGSIDGAVIGGTNPVAGTFTIVSAAETVVGTTVVTLPTGTQGAGTLCNNIALYGSLSPTIIIPSGYVEAPTSTCTIAQNQVKLLFQKGASLTSAAILFSITGSDDSIDGGTFIETGTASTIQMIGAVRTEISHITCAPTASNAGNCIYMSGAYKPRIHDNTLYGTIFGEKNTLDVDEHDNYFDMRNLTTSGDPTPVSYHGTTAGMTVSGLIHDETMDALGYFCGEIGSFEGMNPTISIKNSVCRQHAGGAINCSGWSISGAVNSQFTGLQYQNLSACPNGYAGLEMTGGFDNNYSFNTIRTTSTLQGFSLNKESRATVIGNAGGWMYAGGSTTGWNTSQNLVANNTFTRTPQVVAGGWTAGMPLAMGTRILDGVGGTSGCLEEVIGLPSNTSSYTSGSTTPSWISCGSAASVTATFVGTTMTVTAVASGTLYVGQSLSAFLMPQGVQIAALGTGTGGTGTYTLNQGVTTIPGSESVQASATGGTVQDSNTSILWLNLGPHIATTTNEHALWAQSNGANSTVSQNQFIGNTLVDDGTSAGTMVFWQEDAGAMDSNSFLENINLGFATCFSTQNTVTNLNYGVGLGSNTGCPSPTPTPQLNLIPDSAFKNGPTYWGTLPGGYSWGNSGYGQNDGAVVITGTGSAPGGDVYGLSPITLQPNTQYSASCVIVNTYGTGAPFCMLRTGANNTGTVLLQMAQEEGVAGRVTGTFNSGSNTIAYASFFPSSGVVTSGQPLTFSEPQLNQGTTAFPYSENDFGSPTAPNNPYTIPASSCSTALTDSSAVTVNTAGAADTCNTWTLVHSTSTRTLSVSNMASGATAEFHYFQDSTGAALLTGGSCNGSTTAWALGGTAGYPIQSAGFTLPVQTAASAGGWVTIKFDGTYCSVVVN